MYWWDRPTQNAGLPIIVGSDRRRSIMLLAGKDAGATNSRATRQSPLQERRRRQWRDRLDVAAQRAHGRAPLPQRCGCASHLGVFGEGPGIPRPAGQKRGSRILSLLAPSEVNSYGDFHD